MADVFISYAREDRSRIKPFVELLEQQGWSVWWDREVIPGHSFGSEIDKQISRASCVVVFWTADSIESNWIQAEASEGLERGILIPVLLEDVRVPLVFRHTETVPLFGWPGREEPAELERILTAIARLIGGHPDELNLDYPSPGSRRRGALAGAVVIAIVLAAVVGRFVVVDTGAGRNEAAAPDGDAGSRHIPAAESPPVPAASIAVMPFTDMEADIAPELVRLLSASGSFFVQNPEHVRAYLENPDQVKLDARYSLQGSTDGSNLMVSLFDRLDRTTLWTRTFDLQTGSLRRLTESIVSDVANAFNRPRIELDEVPHRAYLAYLQGKAQLREQPNQAGLKRAEALFRKTIEEAPRFGEGHAGLCETYARMYDETGSVTFFENAERHCFRAATISRENLQVDIALGRLYRIAGKYDAALERLDAASESAPFSTEILRERAMVKHAQNNVDEAIELLQLAQKLEPAYWGNYGALASVYFQTGRFSEAAGQYEAMKGLVADETRLLSDLGSAYYMAEDFDHAIEAWRASLKQARNVNAMSNLGSAYFFNGNYEQAAEMYREATELRPDDPRVWANVGEAAIQIGADATAYFEKVVELGGPQLAINPDRPALLAVMASSFAALGNKEESLRYVDQALSLAQGDVYVLYYVAVAFARLENQERRDEIIGQMLAMGYSETLIQRDANFETRRER